MGQLLTTEKDTAADTIMSSSPSKLFEDFWEWRVERTPEFSSLVRK